MRLSILRVIPASVSSESTPFIFVILLLTHEMNATNATSETNVRSETNAKRARRETHGMNETRERRVTRGTNVKNVERLVSSPGSSFGGRAFPVASLSNRAQPPEHFRRIRARSARQSREPSYSRQPHRPVGEPASQKYAKKRLSAFARPYPTPRLIRVYDTKTD